jgi:uncharacterized protein (UPF0147 family)
MNTINQIFSQNTDELIITIPQFIEDYQFIDKFGNDNSPRLSINAENNNIYECVSDNDILVLSHKMDCNFNACKEISILTDLNNEKDFLKQSSKCLKKTNKDSKKILKIIREQISDLNILKNIRYQIKELKKVEK